MVAVNAVISARVCNEKRIENWPGIYHAVHAVNNYTVRLVEERPAAGRYDVLYLEPQRQWDGASAACL